MPQPLDGFGIYESVNTSAGQGVWGPRLQQIAKGGFKLVMNYNLLRGHIADLIAYINYAATQGLKVIVSLQDPRIWRDNTYSTNYTSLYADSGNAGTGIAFMQYIVGQLKTLPGVWGWYVGDEVDNVDHTTFKTYTDSVKAADSTHPRLIMQNGTGSNAVGLGSDIFYDCCDVLGDDYYPITATTTLNTGSLNTESINVQSWCRGKGIQSAMGLQAHSLVNYGQPTAPWPTLTQMTQMVDTVLPNMSPRLILWFSYFDVISNTAPTLQYNLLVNAIEGRSGLALFPARSRRSTPLNLNNSGVVLADNPTAYYRLNETTGTTAYDGATAYNGTLHGGVTLSQSGSTTDGDTSMKFDGSTGYISLPTGTNGAGYSQLTVEAWVKFSALNIGTGLFANIIQSGSTIISHVGYVLYFTDAYVASFSVGNGASSIISGWPIASPATGVWYHVVGVYDGSTLNIYVNGVPTSNGSSAFTGAVADSGLSPTISRAANATNSFFPGWIDEVAIYPTALSASRILYHYQAALNTLPSNYILFPSVNRRQTN